jgi:hypothetical protein
VRTKVASGCEVRVCYEAFMKVMVMKVSVKIVIDFRCLIFTLAVEYSELKDFHHGQISFTASIKSKTELLKSYPHVNVLLSVVKIKKERQTPHEW